MRDLRNALQAGVFAARKKQKQNCGGAGKRACSDFQ
jgi:hypothetical protein